MTQGRPEDTSADNQPPDRLTGQQTQDRHTGDRSDGPLSPVLCVRGVSKSFGSGRRRKKVLADLSFEVGRNQVVSLLGANGAGKTTLVNIASTLMLPTSGHIEVDGVDVVAQPARVRRLISLTGQFAAVDEELTGRENLVFFARLLGLGRHAARRRADELLEQFRLADAATRRVARYSGGMRRRLDIAASLVVEPRLLFLDEPTTGLDPLSRRELWECVEGLRERGVSVLLTTQYLDEAERLSDDIVLIRQGTTVLQGPPDRLRQQFGAPTCQIGFDNVAEAEQATTEVLAGRLGLEAGRLTREGLTVSFTATRGVDDLSQVLLVLREAGITARSASLSPPTLDDVFLGMAFRQETQDA